MVMRCRKVEKLLPLHVGGDLVEDDARRVDEHLARCLGCFRLFQDYLVPLEALRRLGRQSPPSGATDGLLEAILKATQREGPRAPSPSVLQIRDRLVGRLAAAAAAVLLVVLGTGVLARQHEVMSPAKGEPGSPTSGAVMTISDTYPSGGALPVVGPTDGRETPVERKARFTRGRSRDF